MYGDTERKKNVVVGGWDPPYAKVERGRIANETNGAEG
jgi:hypothetical protein